MLRLMSRDLDNMEAVGEVDSAAVARYATVVQTGLRHSIGRDGSDLENVELFDEILSAATEQTRYELASRLITSMNRSSMISIAREIRTQLPPSLWTEVEE